MTFREFIQKINFNEALDPVVKRRDADINNDCVVDDADDYLANRRAAIADAIRDRKRKSGSTESGELRAIVSSHGKRPKGRKADDQASEFEKHLEQIRSRHST